MLFYKGDIWNETACGVWIEIKKPVLDAIFFSYF